MLAVQLWFESSFREVALSIDAESFVARQAERPPLPVYPWSRDVFFSLQVNDADSQPMLACKPMPLARHGSIRDH